MDEIKKQKNSYIGVGLALVCALHSLIVLARLVFGLPFALVLNANLISTLYATAVIVIAGQVWGKVAQKPDYIPSYHMGVSTVRLLIALAIVFIYILNLDAEAADYDPDTKLVFIVIFAAYYLLLLFHHSVFHSRLNKQ